jgi:hypothetical protein
MTPIAMDSMIPSDLADTLAQQRRILQDHYEVLRALRTRIAENEVRYGIPASDVHQAIDDGRLEETHDVCKWLIDIDLLERLERAAG